MESEDSTSNNGDVKGYKFSGGSNGNTMGKKKNLLPQFLGLGWVLQSAMVLNFFRPWNMAITSKR